MDTTHTDAFERLLARPGVADPDGTGLWRTLQDSGFLDALVPEAQGGAGLSLEHAFGLMFAAGRHALPVPFAHTMLARGLLAGLGHAPPSGPIVMAGLPVPESDPGSVAAHWTSGAEVEYLLAAHGDDLRLIPLTGAGGTIAVRPGISDADGGCGLAETAAAGYAALIAGAAQRVLELTLEHVRSRVQFGRPIGRFQAIQNQISVLAEHTAACRMAAQLACQGRGPRPEPLLAAVGKARTSAAASAIADIGHAVHGAIGMTHEGPLQRYTSRLRAWRRAAGSEAHWHGRLGAALLHEDAGTALAFLCERIGVQSGE